MKWPTLVLALAAAPAQAALTPAELAGAGVSPPPGAALPAGLPFVDQAGRAITLTRARVPTLLLFADYTCGHLCGPGLTLTAGALADAGLKPGRDLRLVVIGLDQDGPAIARGFADRVLDALPDARTNTLLLTGTPATVAAAEAAFGDHAVYDHVADQWAHDAASFVLTPDGRLSRVLPETASTPEMIRGAIASAARGEVALPQPGAVERIVALCYGFAAAHGVNGRAAILALRIAGLLTLAAIAGGIWRLSRRARSA